MPAALSPNPENLMRLFSFSVSTLLAANCVLLSFSYAQEIVPSDSVRFSKPVRLKAGGSFLGANRLYPSPAMHDINNDGHTDIVVGDLRGTVTIAIGQPGERVSFLSETPLKDRSGERLTFSNW